MKFGRRYIVGVTVGLVIAIGAYLIYSKQSDKQIVNEVKVVPSNGANAPSGMVLIPGGEFLMGSDSKQSRLNERPVHRVRVSGFWMDITHVTNDQFAKFVNETNYLTTAEQKPDWETIRVQLPPDIPKPPESALVAGAMVFTGSSEVVLLDDYSQWWAYVPGANWRHPTGPSSSIEGKGNHPVVQVSYEDVMAYAKWAGKRLPTEAEWEFAARGGLTQATYAWGDQLERNGKPQAKMWDLKESPFPVVSPGVVVETSPVASFPPNGYGLFDMAGNAWQWVSDWYRQDYFAIQAKTHGNNLIDNPQGPNDSFDSADLSAPPYAPKRVIRGGSFLCNENYCRSYRPSARRGTDPYSPMSHIGFRLVKDL